MRDDFRIRLGLELVAFFDQLVLQFEVILDDPIVDDDDFSGAISMRVGIFFRGAAMCGPARVSEAIYAVDRRFGQ